jgi:hypothetical protein
VEPERAEVPEVPEVPDAMGSVRCGDCAYFDPDTDECLKLKISTRSDRRHNCPEYSIPW